MADSFNTEMMDKIDFIVENNLKDKFFSAFVEEARSSIRDMFEHLVRSMKEEEHATDDEIRSECNKIILEAADELRQHITEYIVNNSCLEWEDIDGDDESRGVVSYFTIRILDLAVPDIEECLMANS